MGHPVKRNAKAKRDKANFSFVTRRLQGVRPDTPEERAEKDKKINEFLKQRQQGETPDGRK